MKRFVAVLLLVPAVAAAQQSGWSKLGEVVGGSHSEAYNQGVMQAAQQAYMIESARASKLESDRLEAEMRWRSLLAVTWAESGLSQEEADAVAAVYNLNSAQNAITIRVRQIGVPATVNEVWKAYRAYNYQLADQLLVAAQIVLQEQQQKATAAK